MRLSVNDRNTTVSVDRFFAGSKNSSVRPNKLLSTGRLPTLSKWPRDCDWVTQGSVVGPTMLYGYVNDFDSNIRSTARLFADDTILHQQISKTQTDANSLQEDLDQLERWVKTWEISFNASKCRSCFHSNTNEEALLHRLTP